jgi:flagellar hook-basal body complex protein FliE
MSDLTIRHNPRFGGPELKRPTEGKAGKGFGEYIRGAIKSVNDMEMEANRSVEQLMMGRTGIHETMIALQKADISLRFLLQVRNKAMDAYREVMRMQF